MFPNQLLFLERRNITKSFVKTETTQMKTHIILVGSVVPELDPQWTEPVTPSPGALSVGC